MADASTTCAVRRLHESGYDTADWLLTGLARSGFWPSTNAKILDFGCGAGALVYRFRDLGFDAYGFDIHECVKLRSPEDRKYFGFAPQDAVKSGNMRVRPEHVRTPFPDDFFDLVVSTSVLEHVLDHEPLMAETARVLTPQGIAVHVYPGRATFIEPHMYVPLATRVQNWWWLYFWAHLGGRSDFQHEMTARAVADANRHYCEVGISYPPRNELLSIAGRHFDEVRIMNRKWHSLRDHLARPLGIYRGFRQWPVLKSIAMSQLLDVLLTGRKKPAPPAA